VQSEEECRELAKEKIEGRQVKAEEEAERNGREEEEDEREMSKEELMMRRKTMRRVGRGKGGDE